MPNPNCRLIIDGTWFGRRACLLVYWDVTLKRVQWWRLTDGERFLEVLADLVTLKQDGVVCASVTSDGAPGLLAGVKGIYPDIPHQRCVTHVQRRLRSLVTRRPKTAAGRELSILIPSLSRITNEEERQLWENLFWDWCERWEVFLNERSRSKDRRHWWYTHKQLRQARSLIRGALPDLFHYLKDSNIPKTSNDLEGRFSSFKQHYGQHRGLSLRRRGGFIAWYLTVVINGDLPTRNWY